MDLDALRAFVIAAQEHSISGAARRLYRSQSAVTRQIQGVEHEVGGSLLDRRARPLTPTPLGQTVLDYASRALAAIDELKSAAVVTGAEPSGELRLGVSISLGSLLARSRLARFERLFPHVRLSITSDWSPRLVAAVRDQALDAALLFLPLNWTPPESLDARRIATEDLVVIAPRAARVPRRVDLATLARARWVLNPEGCSVRSALRDALVAAGGTLQVGVELNGAALQIELVAAGLGLALVPIRALRAHGTRHAVRILSLSHPNLSQGIWFVVGRLAPPLKPALEFLEAGIARAIDGRGAASTDRGALPLRSHLAPPGASGGQAAAPALP